MITLVKTLLLLCDIERHNWLQSYQPMETIQVAKIVLGMGTSHGPMLSTPPELWDSRVPDDRQRLHDFRGGKMSFDALVAARRDENLAQHLTLEVWRERHARCRAGLAELARVFNEVKPDIAVIVGNDQMEVFRDTLIPAFSVHRGAEIINSEYEPARLARLPAGIEISVPGHIPPGGATYAGAPALGTHITEQLIAAQFDVAAMNGFPRDETPHAFGFVFRQVMLDHVVPTVPVLVNTFYPPNQPSVQRCHDFGLALRQAIESWPVDARVAILASGGLTHFVIDETVDERFLALIRGEGTLDALAGLGEATFQAGTSEIKNWLPVVASMRALDFVPTIVDYVPCYRSEAGTGNAMGFVHWQPQSTSAGA